VSNSASDKRKVNIGVVGCGVVATAYYFPYLMNMPDAELVAVCDLEPKRTAACARLFGAKEQYQDYFEMLQKADIEAVLILTAPGSHKAFAVAAATAGKHFLLQKPMAITMDDALAIKDATRKANVKAVIEPSDHTVLHPHYRALRDLITKGVLGLPYWFIHAATAGDSYSAMLGGNPYGNAAFFKKDSGGMLFDFPYAPNQIVTLLGSCKSVMGVSRTSVPERMIVPDQGYTDFLHSATDPQNVNYWDVVMNAPKTERIAMESNDNVFSLYEMDEGWTGVFHVGRPFHPMPKGVNEGGFKIFGSEGNLIMDMNGKMASLITTRKDLVPNADANGWTTFDPLGDISKAGWPKPIPGGFNYYHVSTQHLVDCILQDLEPVVGIDYGLHVTEMMWGALESSRTGQRYTMTTKLPEVTYIPEVNL
jgi:predicted dehydrogenase